jgi:hypothetical protein
MLDARVQIFAWLMTYENLNRCLAYEMGMPQIRPKNHEREANSWYVSDRPGVFNPYNVSDRVSRKTWYENVTAPDILRNKALSKKFPKVQNSFTNNPINRGSGSVFRSLTPP